MQSTVIECRVTNQVNILHLISLFMCVFIFFIDFPSQLQQVLLAELLWVRLNFKVLFIFVVVVVVFQFLSISVHFVLFLMVSAFEFVSFVLVFLVVIR